ncbi:uncharacterized protein AB9W97_004842 isoform 1-T2 [Spinachia spinachia]
MNEPGFRRAFPEQSLGSGHTSGSPRHPSLIHPILSKRVCFYKSGDPQFSGLRMVINNRTFKTFDALLDSLSKKVPLPFGVRNITTPRGVHAVRTLDELEDGKSYICSDTRKVKPVNLALARKKLAPWYHARPVSPRRRTAQQARNNRSQAPKVLSVFRNGDPGVKHSVVLRKRTTPTFESILEKVSQLMQFHVVKLHAADGRRVDGFPGLILCSGTVVAAGREPFRPANYSAPISPAQSTLPTKRLGPRRLRSLKRKKRSKSYTPKSRNFSLSSERYIVSRIQNSIAGGSCDRPSPSVELEAGHALESVAETPDTGLGVAAEERDSRPLPAEDDIEKSFRVNQDGSMTVEMRVRLTIKEEETVHWTTTLARSSVASQLNSLKSNSVDLESPAFSSDKDKTQDNNDEDPPPLGNGVFGESNNGEDGGKVRTAAESPRSPPTSGREGIRKKQASVEAEGVQEGTVGSYSYREQTQSGTVTQRYCVVKQKSSRPVPKPRRQSSVEVNNAAGRNLPTSKSAATSEIRRVESAGEEVSETVFHVYEQQACQENFFANLCSRDMSAFGIPFCRPVTSETGQLFEPPHRRPSTASESIGMWRADSTSVTPDLNLPPLGTRQRRVNEDKRASSKPKVVTKSVRGLKRRGEKRRENSAAKTFSSAGSIKRIYGNKSKSLKSTVKPKKGPAPKGDGGATTGSSPRWPDTVKRILKDLNMPLALKETAVSETVSSEKGRLNAAPIKVSQPGGFLEWQTSRRREEKKEGESCNVSDRMSLPAFNSSSAVTNEYVENWLEKACLNPSADSDEDSKKREALTFVQPENGRCVETERKKALTLVAGDQKCLEDTSGEPNAPLPQDELEASVKQRIRSFESKPSSQSTKRAAVKQQLVCSQEATTNTENYLNSARIHTDQIKPPAINDTPTETPQGVVVDNKSSGIQISFKKEAPLNARSKGPPTPLPNTEGSTMGESSACGSQTPHKHPLSVSRTSDRAGSPPDHTAEVTTSIHLDTSGRDAAALPRTPSIKRAPLVSNKSLDRKMSLRKACLEKYTLCSDGTSQTSTSSTPIESVGDNALPSGIWPSGGRAEEPQRSRSTSDVTSSPSRRTPASPARCTSEERTSSFTISSLSLKDTKTAETRSFAQKEAMSPKPLVESAKHGGSSSPGRKSQHEPQNSPKLSSSHNRPSDSGIHQTPNADSPTERKLNRPKSHKRRSPYSQSLDVASSPVRHKTGGRRRHRTPRTANPAAELGKAATRRAPAALCEESKFHVANQPNVTPVLERICYSMKSIGRITQNKRPSCLEKSNSLPDFSSHVASTFRSSSQALLAFLSVVTLKDGLADASADKLAATDVSCAEALKMIDSLREIASTDDSHELKASLSSLRRSASKQLLHSWKGFQDVSDKHGSPRPSDSDAEVAIEAVCEKDCGIEAGLDEEESNRRSEVEVNSDDEEELDVRRGSRTSSADSGPLSEEEQPDVACRAASTGSGSSVDESTWDADVDHPSSDEEQPEVEGMRLKVIAEESVLGGEEEEEEHLDAPPGRREQTRKYRESVTSIEESEDHNADETYICGTVERDPSRFIGNQDSYDILTRIYGLNEDEDSGNDHSSCEEHVQMEQPKVEDKPPNTSGYEDKESCSSEEEGVHIDGYTDEGQAASPQSKDTKGEKVVEITSQSVAHRVILLEKQVAVAQKTTESSDIRRSSQRKAPLGPDEEDSPSDSQATAGAQSAPQSSLSFSYDSSGVITSEPEGHRVRSIREMFLAKTATDVQHRRLPSSKTSEARAETSVSGGYQTQTSSELSSGEDDAARKSITKGFVRRTIERLYGKKDARPEQEAGGTPPSAPQAKKKEHLSAFSPFRVSRSKAMSEFSYFNSTHAVEPFGEASRCVAFHAEVRPEAPVDHERWLLRENNVMRKSVSEPVAINQKDVSNPQGGDVREDAEEDPPYSLFNTKSEPEDKQSCTYFSLPHTSDPDAQLDEPRPVSRSSARDTEEGSEDTGPRAERGAVADFRRKANKVHPVAEAPPDGEVVLVQPEKRQGVMSTRFEEPDVLDILYNFCGQNCPIL